MCNNLAKNGDYHITLLDDQSLTDGSYDCLINGLKADLKQLSSHNNIHKQASNAIHKKKADIVVFEFTNDTPEIRREINALKERGYRFIYYFSYSPQEIIEVL